MEDGDGSWQGHSDEEMEQRMDGMISFFRIVFFIGVLALGIYELWTEFGGH